MSTTCSCGFHNADHLLGSGDANFSISFEATAATTPGDTETAISSFIRWIFEITVSYLLTGLVSLLGIASNILCIVVFVRLDLQDSVNIPLLGLAVSDLCCDVTMFWCVICQGITRFGPVTFPVEPFGLMIMTASYPRVIFSRVTSWLTALISLERCACVAFPLKVKSIFTPRNTGVMTFTLFTILLASNMLIYYPRAFQMKSNPNLNLNRLTMVILTDRLNRAAIINAILFISLPLINLILVIGCAAVLIIKLERSQKWRQHAQSGDQPMKRSPQKLIRLRPKTTSEHQDGMKLKKSMRSAKELKLTKMITSLTVIFLACNTPSNGLLAASIFVPGFTSTGKFAELFQMLHSVAFFLETVNSSVNLLVYYAMSSKFKAQFTKLLTGPWRAFKMVETSHYPLPQK